MWIYIIGSLIFSCVVAYLADSWGRKFSNYFLLSFFLSPIVGILILLFKGKLTKEEVLNNTPHIFYCPSCKSTYSGETNVNTKCPDCNIFTEETTILRDDWRTFSQEKKEQLKESFSNGIFLRKSANQSVIVEANGGADELKKYKELLDMGAITQDEYNAKKKQILKL